MPGFFDFLFGSGRRTEDINLPINPTYHPAGLKESTLEKIIKENAKKYGNLLAADMPYLEQYLHPEHDMLEKQSLRPSIGKFPDIPFRKTDKFNQGQYDEEGFKPTKLNLHPTKVHNVEGLGSYRYDTRNPEYDSIYDVWDFDTKSNLIDSSRNFGPSLESMAKQFMKYAGTPYAVYERVPKGTMGRGMKIE